MITAVVFQKGDCISVLITFTTNACSSSGFELPAMGVLVRLRLEVTDSRQVSRVQRIEKVVEIVLMVGCVTRQTDTRHAGRARMGGVGRARVELERLMVRHVIRFRQPGDGRHSAPVAARGPVRIGDREIEAALEPTPGKSGGVEQIAHVALPLKFI